MRLFFVLFLCVSPSFCWSYPIAERLGPAAPEFIQIYFQRMQEWHSRTWPEFKTLLSPDEQRLVSAWKKDLKTWSTPIESHQQMDHFQFIHELKDGKIHHDEIRIMSPSWSPESKMLIKTYLKKRGLELPDQDRFFGIGWKGPQKEITLILRHENAKDRLPTDLRKISEQHDSKAWSPLRFSFISYSGKKKSKSQLWVAAKSWKDEQLPSDFPSVEVVGFALLINSQGERLSHLRMKSYFSAFFDPQIDQVARLIDREFVLMTTSFEFQDKKNLRILYP